MGDTPKTPATRGLRTALQTLGGLFVGLVLVVWNVPGVPEAVHAYITTNFVPFLLGGLGLVAVPAGLIAWVQNHLEQKRTGV